MRIGLHDADGHSGFPNLALMKLSAWHKGQGDDVEWWRPECEYDKVYSSKVFTFTPEEPYLPVNTVRGGTGYGKYEDLPVEVDRMFPDYSLYPGCDYAVGFLTRGCVRKCPWCVVPKKEGWIRPYMTWREIKRPEYRDIRFMDNNVLASDFGREQMVDMIGQKVRIDFNQGMDARLVDDEIADVLSRLKWIRWLRFSCDTDAMLDTILQKIDLLKRHGIKPWRIFVYTLVQDIPSAERRAIALRAAGVDVFAQPYRDFTTNAEPAIELKRLARWVNSKQIFKTVERFADYDSKVRKGR
jgi:hypothetical protein